MDRFSWMLLGYVLFILLNILDVWITSVILTHPKGRETNIFMRFLMKYFGLKGLIGFKLLLIIWFGLQCFFHVLDLYTIFYLDFVFVVILILMSRDAVRSGLSTKLNPLTLLRKRDSLK